MANKVRYGLKSVYYATVTVSGSTVTYGTPVSWPGAVSLTLDPAGEDPGKFYADDVNYFTIPGTDDGYTGTLETALIPDSFLTNCLGYKADNNGNIYEDAPEEPSPFALLFEFTGDDKQIRHVIYNCLAGRPSVSGQTKGNTISVQTESISIVASPAVDTNVVKMKCDPSGANYSTWYSAVVAPVVS